MKKILYVAKVTSTGRDGRSTSSDGLLDIQLARPATLGGNGTGTNPEQLFAAGFSACFLSALRVVAHEKKLAIPQDAKIDAEVSLAAKEPFGYELSISLNISLPGMDKTLAENLVAVTDQVCPYANATRNNIDVVKTITV